MRGKLLVALLSFNAITAIGGGLALIMGLNTPPQSWLDNTPFNSYLLPGLVLLFIVGGSALYGLLHGLITHSGSDDIRAFLSGIILLGWIIGEIAILRQFSWLQIVYLLTGGVVAVLARTSVKDMYRGLAVHED